MLCHRYCTLQFMSSLMHEWSKAPLVFVHSFSLSYSLSISGSKHSEPCHVMRQSMPILDSCATVMPPSLLTAHRSPLPSPARRSRLFGMMCRKLRENMHARSLLCSSSTKTKIKNQNMNRKNYLQPKFSTPRGHTPFHHHGDGRPSSIRTIAIAAETVDALDMSKTSPRPTSAPWFSPNVNVNNAGSECRVRLRNNAMRPYAVRPQSVDACFAESSKSCQRFKEPERKKYRREKKDEV